MTLLTACTATMKYHMAANQVQAASETNTGWFRKCGDEPVVADAPAGNDVIAVAESNCFRGIATKSVIEDCAVALGRTATVTPSLADARQQIESCLVRQGYERAEVVRFDSAPPRTPCTSLYPLERCPMPVEPKP
jgi:hypothetical protein